MAESPHYKDLLQLLNKFQVEYLIVGGFAVMKYGEPRYTKDLDIWVSKSPENSTRLVAALAKPLSKKTVSLRRHSPASKSSIRLELLQSSMR